MGECVFQLACLRSICSPLARLPGRKRKSEELLHLPDKPAGGKNRGESLSNNKTSLLPGKPAAGEMWVKTRAGVEWSEPPGSWVRAPTWDKPAYEGRSITD